jgi:hypothetical protein
LSRQIETAYLELKSTILGGRVLRARTPTGLNQEIHAPLITYQAPRIAISDATLNRPDPDPDRASFTVALAAARDQLVQTAGVITDTTVDPVGSIGRQVLDHRIPDRRPRTTPRVVKPAISNYITKTATGRIRGPSRKATIDISILRIGP